MDPTYCLFDRRKPRAESSSCLRARCTTFRLLQLAQDPREIRAPQWRRFAPLFGLIEAGRPGCSFIRVNFARPETRNALIPLVRPADCTNMCMRAALILAWMLASVSMTSAVVSPGRHPYRKHWKQTTVAKRPVARVLGRAGVKTLPHAGGL